MLKIIRVFIGTALGLWIAQYFVHFGPRLGAGTIMTYFLATLIVMAAVFVLKGLNF